MNDQVPAKWKSLFTNEEWLEHQLMVYGSWAFFVIAIILHIVFFSVKPWIAQ
ncbi:MAG: light-harvesting antenna LH1, beta subunit [Anaerolineae bacterium]